MRQIIRQKNRYFVKVFLQCHKMIKKNP